VRNRREKGMALATALLVLMLVSSMIVGLSWLVMTDQKLGGNNSDRQRAFYGAEAGMEALTAGLSNSFNANYALSAGDITTLLNTTYTNTTNIPNVAFQTPTGTNGFELLFTPDTAPGNLGNPLATKHTILSGNYAGLVGLLTPYTMQVTARTNGGSEAKLQRTVQTVAIPVFQFGIFSQTDLSFFAGPNFNFGGRVHSNGNLWLAEGSGSTLTMADKVTSAGEIIRSNLQNGWPTSTNYTGTVTITTNPGSASFVPLTAGQGSVNGPNSITGLGGLNEPAFSTLAKGTYNGNIGVKETGVQPLNLTIATPAIGGIPIDMIRLPVPNENATNPGKLSERYFSQASLRILLADYGPSGTCADSDLTTLPLPSAGAPVDLATLAWDTSSPGGTPPYKAAPAFINAANVGVSVYPMPVSAATGAVYTPADGYWVTKWWPIETGCLKIDYQTKAGGAFTDVTAEILNLGYTGRNINPQSKATMSIAGNQSPNRLALPGAQTNGQGPTIDAAAATVGCLDPSPNAVIRLSRIRDNPSFANGVGGCGVPFAGPAIQHGTDFWPNVLFDPREGNLRDTVLAGNPVTLAGTMHYVELDVNNLARWFTGAIGASGANANNLTGYTLYFSDRRGDRKDPTPPPSVPLAPPAKTGGFGYDDIANGVSAPLTGCPNGGFEQGEDLEDDFNNNGVGLSPALRVYGGTFPTDAATNPNNLWKIGAAAINLANVLNTVVANNPNCGGPGKDWPYAIATNAQDVRENPSVFFRRALKLVNGSTIALGVCDAVACGLTVVAENPVYVQGDYNANAGNCAGCNGPPPAVNAFNNAFVAAAVMGDAVTFLSNRWNDINSFAFPYNLAGRAAITTNYRTAIVGGKGIPFLNPAGTGQDYGTDGGTHNFLRYIENWGGQELNYKGSIVSLYFSHQAVGTYKCCTTVYSPPTRGYNFQTEFLTPSLLPPRTPMFRAINTIGFTQLILPTQ
jgi:hypothetical protein